MKDLLKKTVKAGALWFVAGALFCTGANLIGPLLGTGPIATLAATVSPIWIGCMMAGATMIATAAEPLINKVFGHKPADAPDCKPDCKDKSIEQVNVTIVQSPQQSQAQFISESQSNYRQSIAAEKIALASDPNVGLS